VSNAGGLDPADLAEQIGVLGARLGLAPKVAFVTGDDLGGRLAKLQAAGHELANLDTGQKLAEAGVEPVTAHAYLGAWGITEALGAGADVVVTGRVTDAALVVGPAAWWHGWGRHDLDALAGAVAPGHVIECGPQATGARLAGYAGFHTTTAPRARSACTGRRPFRPRRYGTSWCCRTAHGGRCPTPSRPGRLRWRRLRPCAPNRSRTRRPAASSSAGGVSGSYADAGMNGWRMARIVPSTIASL
jgi:hypothetical protein